MSITYEEALSTLNSMFGPPWTSDHLDAVLRHHQGHMENTVESVLNHGDGDPNVLIQQLKDGTAPSPGSGSGSSGGGGAGAGGGTEHTVNVDEELARQLANEEEKRGRGGTIRTTTRRVVPAPAQQPSVQHQRQQQSHQRPAPPSPVPPSSPAPSPPAPAPPSAKTGRGTPISLPEDFLRVPGRTPSAQEDADEQLARMLQDELFAKELKNNPEFAHLARGRSSRGGHGMSSPGRAMAGGHGYGRSAAGYPGVSRGEGHDNRMAEVGQELVDGISKLGIAAKSRLQSLAANFNAQMQGGHGGGGDATGTVGGAGAAGSHRERRGLLDGEDEDEEEVSFLRGSGGAVGGGGGPRGTDVEMRPVGSTGGSSSGGGGGGGFLSGWGGGGGDGKKKD